MPQNFESLREQLLRAGIAPRRVRRYVTELREHLADLTERERASGLDAGQARERAIALLGGDAELARAMIQRAPARSLAARAPWAVFVMSPLLLLVGTVFAVDFLMMHVLWPVRTLPLAQMPGHYRGLIELVSFCVNYLVGALLAAGCILMALRQRLSTGWIWVGLGLIAAISGTLGFHAHGSFSMVDIVYVHERPSLPATLAVVALRATVFFAVAATAYRALRSRALAR